MHLLFHVNIKRVTHAAHVFRFTHLFVFIAETVEISVRDCAPQKYMYQVYTEGQWKLEKAVQADVYSTGCQLTDNSAGLKTNSELYCYCSENLCNSGKTAKDTSTHTDIMTVIFVFNAMKYIRSIR